jgi:UDPglucose 6-dehydrogenase
MKITVYGAGYVGLVAAACFAESGNEVLAVDPDPKRLASLQAGRVPFLEAGLDELVAKGISTKRLTFSGDPEAAAGFSGMHFLAVGTPSSSDGSTDESQLIAAAHAIGRGATGDVVVVVKSTAPVGAAERIIDEVRHEFAQRSVTYSAEVVVNPEFLRAGSAVKDFFEPDRVVVGGESSSAVAAVASLYTPFVTTEKILIMDAASASLVKYAANAMLATRVSFMNELANLAEALGADIEGVRRGLGGDPRIGSQYLNPGMGYGGSCLPKDVASLIAVGEVAGVTMGVARAAAEANDVQPHRMTDKLERHLGDLAGRTIAVWGIAFKAGTDDMRDAPSRILISDLLTAGATIRAFDPAAGEGAAALYAKEPGVQIVASAEEALKGSDALAIAADWPEFRAISPETIVAALHEPLVVDGRNIFNPAVMRTAGVTYCGVGRGDA